MIRRLLVPILVVTSVACGSDGPTAPTFGSMMSVGDQVAIEAALRSVADTLEVRGATAQDTLIADLTRIAAIVVQLQGREGTLLVTMPGANGPVSMKAVAFVSAVEGGTVPPVHFLIAWEWLDNVAIRLRRALVVMAEDPAEAGTFTLDPGSPTDGARFIDFVDETARLYVNTGGTFTVTSPTFSGSCIGLPPGGDFGCRAGGELVAGSVSVSGNGGATTGSVSWSSTALPAFRASVR
jgi:hypothetical protein